MANEIIPLDIPNARVPVVDKHGVLAKHIVRLITDIIRRLGGQRQDYVQQARAAALESQAMVLAVLRGVSAGYYHTPSNPLSFTATSATQATIVIAEHTRSTAASTIAAGTILSVSRGAVYYVYYDDAGNAGGSVSFSATTSVASLTTAGRKLVGAIYVDTPTPTGGTAT